MDKPIIINGAVLNDQIIKEIESWQYSSNEYLFDLINAISDMQDIITDIAMSKPIGGGCENELEIKNCISVAIYLKKTLKHFASSAEE